MSQFRYTLLGDGSSDRCLVPILDWTLARMTDLLPEGFTSQVADLRGLPVPVVGLRNRILLACRQFHCEILFVHRDAESEPAEHRVEEIAKAVAEAAIPLHVPVVPVRMTEAWLLIDEKAIRRAAGNPEGSEDLPIPKPQKLEGVPDAKSLLHECLLSASETRGRRRDQFRRDLGARVYRVADLIEDFSPLRQLDAFRRFETATRGVIEQIRSRTP